MNLYAKVGPFQFYIGNMWEIYLSKNIVSDVRNLYLLNFNFTLREYNLKEFTERLLELEIGFLGIRMHIQFTFYKKKKKANLLEDTRIIAVPGLNETNKQ